MSTRQVSDRNDPVIESREQLLAPMIKGEKPRERWRIGTEHEKLVYSTTDHHAPSYDEPGGVRDMLMALTEFGWEPVIEGGKVIALAGSDGTVSATIAGQTEASQIGQIQIAAFPNSAGLQAIGGNMLVETQASGAPLVGGAGEEGRGHAARRQYRPDAARHRAAVAVQPQRYRDGRRPAVQGQRRRVAIQRAVG